MKKGTYKIKYAHADNDKIVKGYHVTIANIDCFLHRYPNSWVATDKYSYAAITNGKNRKQVIDKAEKLLLANANKVQKMREKRRKQLFRSRAFTNDKVQEYFESIFNKPLKMFADRTLFIVNQYALDIISFDKFLKTPDGISMRDHIKQIYGQTATNLVEFLI